MMKNRSGNHQQRDVDYNHYATADPMMMSRSDSAMTFRRDASTSMTTRGEDDEKYTTRENSVFSLNHAPAQAKPRMSRLGDASKLWSSGRRQPEEVLDADAEDCAMMMTMVARRRWYTLVRTHALSDCATVAVNDAELAMLEAEILCAEGGAGTPGPRRRVATVADVGAGGASGRGGMPDGDDLEEEYEEEAVVVVGGDIWKTSATTTTTTAKDGRTANATADATTSALRAQDSAEDGATLARNPPAVAANNASQQKPGGPCDHCGAVDSPQWRRGPATKPMLCNACGTRYRRTNNLGAAPSRSGTPEKRRANAIVSSTSNANSPRPGKKSARYAPAVERNHRTTVTC